MSEKIVKASDFMTRVAIKKGNPKASLREDAEQGAPIACRTCGGNIREGCKLHQGMAMFACPKFQPLQ